MHIGSGVDPFVNVTTDVIKSQSVHLGSTMAETADPFVQSFWYWNKFSTYLLCLFCIAVVLSLVTSIFRESAFYVGALGMLSSGIEVSHAIYLSYRSFLVGTPRSPTALAELLPQAHARARSFPHRHVALRRHVQGVIL